MTNALGEILGSGTSSTPGRIARIAAGDKALEDLIQEMVGISIHALPTMYLPDQRHFGFTRRRGEDGIARLEGTSLRYSSIVLLGAMHLPEALQRQVLSGQTADGFCGRLCQQIASIENLGNAALLAWAAAELQHAELLPALQRMEQLLLSDGHAHTVEAAWVLSAQTAACVRANACSQPEAACERLLAAFRNDSGIFPYVTDAQMAPWYRAHVACFADQVYPIQALSRYYKAFRCEAALDIANRCAAQICKLQGPAGQWWWHYDVRTGEVIEGYPVYSVHQDAMAPMALLDLYDAGGTDHAESIRRGLGWMLSAPEVCSTLIDDELQLIWRKVGRREPRKMTRAVRAMSTRLHPSLRLQWLDRIAVPSVIDFESRPYHLAWILAAWLGGLR